MNELIMRALSYVDDRWITEAKRLFANCRFAALLCRSNTTNNLEKKSSGF